MLASSSLIVAAHKALGEPSQPAFQRLTEDGVASQLGQRGCKRKRNDYGQVSSGMPFTIQVAPCLLGL